MTGYGGLALTGTNVPYLDHHSDCGSGRIRGSGRVRVHGVQVRRVS